MWATRTARCWSGCRAPCTTAAPTPPASGPAGPTPKASAACWRSAGWRSSTSPTAPTSRWSTPRPGRRWCSTARSITTARCGKTSPAPATPFTPPATPKSCSARSPPTAPPPAFAPCAGCSPLHCGMTRPASSRCARPARHQAALPLPQSRRGRGLVARVRLRGPRDARLGPARHAQAQPRRRRVGRLERIRHGPGHGRPRRRIAVAGRAADIRRRRPRDVGRTIRDPRSHRRAPRPPRPTSARQLEESVRLHLVSDVPLGVFLSGGVDSGAVANLAQRAMGSERLNTFTLAFEEQAYNEGDHARAIAAAIGTRPPRNRADANRGSSSTSTPRWTVSISRPSTGSTRTSCPRRARGRVDRRPGGDRRRRVVRRLHQLPLPAGAAPVGPAGRVGAGGLQSRGGEGRLGFRQLRRAHEGASRPADALGQAAGHGPKLQQPHRPLSTRLRPVPARLSPKASARRPDPKRRLAQRLVPRGLRAPRDRNAAAGQPFLR